MVFIWCLMWVFSLFVCLAYCWFLFGVIIVSRFWLLCCLMVVGFVWFGCGLVCMVQAVGLLNWFRYDYSFSLGLVVAFWFWVA